MYRVMGVDPSLTSTGVAYRVASGVRAYTIQTKYKGTRRLRHIRDALLQHIKACNPTLVAMEGYALGFRGKSNTVFGLGELGGVLRVALAEQGLEVLIVPPTSLKMYITGSGRADKDEVKDKLVTTYKAPHFPTSDQYDAYGLLLMGEEVCAGRQGSKVSLPYRSRALAGCALMDF